MFYFKGMLFKKDKLFLISFLIILNSLFFSMKEVKATGEMILRDGNSFVKIKELNKRSKAIYGELDHPYSFSEHEIINSLSDISFQKKGIFAPGKTEHVFSRADLEQVLAPLLVEGFARVNPTQYLLVYNSLTRSFLKNKHNYFCMFVMNHNLYILFGRIHQDLTHPYFDEENIVKNGIEFENPMDEKKPGLWKLVPSSGQYLKSDQEYILVIPINENKKDPLISKDDKNRYTPNALRKKSNDKGNVIDNIEDSKIPVNTDSKTEDSVSYSLKEQLKLLKSLLNEELISNENYERKKNELLDEYFGVLGN